MSQSTLDKLKQAQSGLNQLKRSDYCEMVSLLKPPIKVQIILTLVMILMGKECDRTQVDVQSGCYDWADIKREIHKIEFPSRILNIDRVSREYLEIGKDFIGKQNGRVLDVEEISKYSLLAARMCEWAIAMMEHSA